jgi:hypothetical protein
MYTHCVFTPVLRCSNFLCADDGTTPNFTKLWEDYTLSRDQIACLLTPGFVCAKWTSYYDDAGKDFRNNLLLHQAFS